MFTVCTWFQNFTFFSHPDSSHFLDWFFNWLVGRHRTFLDCEWWDLSRSNLWCLRFYRRCCRWVKRILRLWTIWSLWFFWFFARFWSRCFWFFTGFWCWRSRGCCWWCIWRYRRINGWFLRSNRFFRFNWFVWNRCRTFRRFHRFSRFNRRFWLCWFNRNGCCKFRGNRHPETRNIGTARFWASKLSWITREDLEGR